VPFVLSRNNAGPWRSFEARTITYLDSMLLSDPCERNSQAEIVPFENLQRYLGDEGPQQGAAARVYHVVDRRRFAAAGQRERLRCLYARIRPRDRRADDALRCGGWTTCRRATPLTSNWRHRPLKIKLKILRYWSITFPSQSFFSPGESTNARGTQDCRSKMASVVGCDQRPRYGGCNRLRTRATSSLTFSLSSPKSPTCDDSSVT
jgi:hypothetical protein